MRLGAYDCTLEPGTLAATAYGALRVSERHRHRYEFNDRYEALFEEHRMRFSGHHVTGRTTLVEVIELPPICIRGSSARRPIRSSSRGRPGRRRSIATSSARRSNTAMRRDGDAPAPARSPCEADPGATHRRRPDEERGASALARTLASVPAGAPARPRRRVDATAPWTSRACRGATVVVRPWAGFVDARRYALGAVDDAVDVHARRRRALDDALRSGDRCAAPGERAAGFGFARVRRISAVARSRGAAGARTPLRCFEPTTRAGSSARQRAAAAECTSGGRQRRRRRSRRRTARTIRIPPLRVIARSSRATRRIEAAGCRGPMPSRRALASCRCARPVAVPPRAAAGATVGAACSSRSIPRSIRPSSPSESAERR